MEEKQCRPAMARQTGVSSSSTAIKHAGDKGVTCLRCLASYRATGLGLGGLFAYRKMWYWSRNGHGEEGGAGWLCNCFLLR
ncbi:hypothetical protein E2C01_017417 [Portunus trituberculatus]|uniref:Uncharacterized protein n=1 Tax=Portunus trituberculatus TaxID=210409 RepID=A0A5B7DTR4_PORTR|nr:hypothetical protein [Portunus trituberculatus]